MKFMIFFHLSAAAVVGIASLQGVSAIDTVDKLIIGKYLGRWYQAYGNAFTARTITRDSTCVAADYGLDEATGNITVINSDRKHIPTGELNTIAGYAYSVDESKPGQLKVHLGQVPVDGDYWIVGLGPTNFGPKGSYQWAIVSGPEAESLFILVRDVPEFEEKYAEEVLALVKDLGFTGPAKEPQRIVQEGCLPFDPITMTMTLGKEEQTDWTDWVDSVLQNTQNEKSRDTGRDDAKGAKEYLMEQVARPRAGKSDGRKPLWEPVVTVTTLDVDRYTGSWYQAYSSLTVAKLLEQNGACVTADYAKQEDGTVSVVNTARKGSVDGDLITMDGYAYYKDKSKPGKLTVHLDGVPVDAPYWVLALGDEDGDGPYPWSIVSDPLRAFLFLLVRDPDEFYGSQDEADVLAKCKELGFTSFWNTPQKTSQEGCEYPSNPTAAPSTDEKDEKQASSKISPGFNLRRRLGLLGPLHASCKMMVEFPENTCEEAMDNLVTAAKSMSGFGNCDGGNKCGYTVSTVAEHNVALVHETSVQHYKDDLTFTFARKGGSCEASAFSTSQTWYAVLDNSVNYCNLHNLVEAGGLKYEEMDVSDKVCTQYSSADCERY